MKRVMGKKDGFTLIEIIAVLLVLAVLAAVAVPRYLSLVDDARTRALDGALAAGYSQLSLTYAQLALSSATGTPPTADALAAAATANPPEGDFTYGFAADGNDITVTVTDAEGNSTDGEWTLP